MLPDQSPGVGWPPALELQLELHPELQSTNGVDWGNPGSGNPSSGNPNASWFLYYLLSFVDNIYIPNWDSVLPGISGYKTTQDRGGPEKKGVHCPELCQFVMNTVFKVKKYSSCRTTEDA